MRTRLHDIGERYLTAGSPLVLMGALWLCLWLLPWRQWALADPHWGHNYAEAAAFLAVGLAWFNRRLLSDLFALAASLLVIPASLELLPHSATAIAGAALVALIITDMALERGRATDIGQPANRRLRAWLKSHLLRFALLMLAHIALTYFLVRLPGDTYETEVVTQIFDALSIPFLILALMEGPVKTLLGAPTGAVGCFWGLGTMLVSLALLAGQPETWPVLAITLLATGVAIAAAVAGRRGATSAASDGQ
jgi:hypothetical protein